MDRILRVLAALMRHGPADRTTLQELAQETGLPQSTVHRILAACISYGMATQTEDGDRRYAVGPGLLALGLSAAAEWGFRPIAQSVLDALAHEVAEECYMTMRVGDHGVFVERSQSPRPIRVIEPLFENLPLHVGASRKLLLAYCDETYLELYLKTQKLERFTPHTITDAKELRQELRRIRDQGFSVSRGERSEGVVGVAGPVFGPMGGVLASVSVLGPSTSLSGERIPEVADAVRTAAGEITTALAAATRSIRERDEELEAAP